jgi:membrane-bound ClpP family serine protease
MKSIGAIALAIGVISLIAGIVLRVLEKQINLGLVPSSFLEFSIACFLLTIALDVIGKK